MNIFVTVGSTRFDALVRRISEPETLEKLRKKGYKTLVVQCGNSAVDDAGRTLAQGETETRAVCDMEIQRWKFKPSLQSAYEAADLVISHAGSGTIIDVLRLGKPLIVVPNPTLADNHQEELAVALTELKHLHSATIDDLPDVIERFDASQLVPFPAFEASRFSGLLDEIMEF